MALDTLDGLMKEVTDYSHRNDLGTKMLDFVRIAEDAMYSNDISVLKVRSMETVSTALTAGQYIELPPYFESARSVRLSTGDQSGKLTFQSPEQMLDVPYSGKPLFYTIIGNEIQFDRVPDFDYTLEIQYFRKAQPLTETNQTNEILLSNPSIYLYGSLAAVFGYAQDNEQEALYSAKFISAIKGANKADKKGRYGTAPSMSFDKRMVV